MVKIPFYTPLMTERYAAAVAMVVSRGQIGPGPAVAEFAERLSTWYGGAQVALTTSGTVALQLAAFAIGLRPGDTIICPAYGVISVPNAFAWMGLKVRFVDIATDGNYNIEALGQALLHIAPKAVCNVDFGGSMSASSDVVKLCAAMNVRMIDDGSCGIVHHDGTARCGLYGDIGVVSFSVPKLITTGQGGAVICRNAEQVRMIRTAIDQGRPWMEAVGTNLRMTDMQAALGIAQMDDLQNIVMLKDGLRQCFYDEGVNLLTATSGPLHYHVVFAESQRAAEALIKLLAGQGIEAKQQYGVHTQSVTTFGAQACAGPTPRGALWFRSRAVYLPFGLTLTEDDVHEISKVVVNFAPLAPPNGDVTRYPAGAENA